MATLFYRLGKTAYRRWPFFIAAWLVAMVAVGTVAGTMSKPMTDAFSIPGIPSEKAADLQAELFPDVTDAFDEASVNVVVAAPEGHSLEEPAYAKAVDALVADLRDLPQVAEDAPIANPVDSAKSQRQQMLEAARQSGTPPDVAKANAAALSPLTPDARVGIISFQYDVETVADVLAGHPGRAPRRPRQRPRQRPDRRGQRLRHVRDGRAGWLLRADRHRRRAARPAADLRLAGRRRPADHHRDVRCRARHHRRHRDDRVHGHRLQHPDAGHDDRPRRRHRLHAVHPGSLPHRARAHRRPRGGDRRRRRHRRLRRRVRRTHRPDRAVGPGRRGDPVPHRDGSGRRRDRPDRRARGAHPAARDPRHAQVQGLRRPGAQVRAAPRARREAAQQRRPLGPLRRPPAGRGRADRDRRPGRARAARSRTCTSRSRPTAPPRSRPPSARPPT